MWPLEDPRRQCPGQINFDETRISLDKTDTQRVERPSLVLFYPNKPRPGSSTTESSVSLTMILGGTAASASYRKSQ